MMDKRAELQFWMVMFILALLFLALMAWVFREQIGNVLQNIAGLTPKNETITNLSTCINNPGLPECQNFG